MKNNVKKSFIMINSCQANIETRISQIYKLWLNYCNIPYKIIIGRPEQEEKYVVEGDFIYLKCDDGYLNLPEKVKKGIRAVKELYDPDCIFKCDDDIVINLEALNNFLNEKRDFDYAGLEVNIEKIKFKKPEICGINCSKSFIDRVKNRENFKYCGGPLYYLSKKAIKIFIKDKKIYDKNEDINISYTLLRKKILPYSASIYINYYKTLGNISDNAILVHLKKKFYRKKEKKNFIGIHYQKFIMEISRNIYVNICGGIGNRLFQLAFLLNIKKNFPHFNCYVLNPENENHGIDSNWYKKIIDGTGLKKLKKKNYPDHFKKIKEADANIYTKKIMEKITHADEDDHLLIRTYFQSEKYFKENQHYIKDVFMKLYNDDTKMKLIEKYNNINFNNSFFIHIRGTDYVNNTFHEINLKKYIDNCINDLRLNQDLNNIKIIVFTNDKKYSKNILKKLKINYLIIEDNPFNTLYLMSICSIGGICSNSTFSWWGAWFNKDRLIYMPFNWFGEKKEVRHYKDIYFGKVKVIKDE